MSMKKLRSAGSEKKCVCISATFIRELFLWLFHEICTNSASKIKCVGLWMWTNSSVGDVENPLYWPMALAASTHRYYLRSRCSRQILTQWEPLRIEYTKKNKMHLWGSREKGRNERRKSVNLLLFLLKSNIHLKVERRTNLQFNIIVVMTGGWIINNLGMQLECGIRCWRAELAKIRIETHAIFTLISTRVNPRYTRWHSLVLHTNDWNFSNSIGRATTRLHAMPTSIFRVYTSTANESRSINAYRVSIGL